MKNKSSAELQGPVYTANIRSNNIFNIEVNRALANTRYCAQLDNAKSGYANILYFRFLSDIYLLMT